MHVLILELAHAFVILFRHHAKMIDIGGQSVPLVRELDVAESALVPQRLEVLLS